MEEQLIRLGLTKNESKIYLYLLKNPYTTTGPIIKNTKIANSRVYESLNSLSEKGLVSYFKDREGKKYSAAEPAKFLEREEERKKRVEKLIPDLEQLRNHSQLDTETAVFEGIEGFKTAFRKIVNDCPQNGTIHILGFSEQMYKNEYLRLFLSNMNRKSDQKKQKLKIILDETAKKSQAKDRESEDNTEVRYMPKGYLSPAAIDIFDDYVYIFLWDENPYVFMIKNKKVATSFLHYFDFMWQTATL